MKGYIQESPKHECGEYFKYVENYIKRIDSKNSIDFGPIYYTEISIKPLPSEISGSETQNKPHTSVCGKTQRVSDCKKCRVYCIKGKEFKSKKQLNESTDNNSTLEKKLRKIMYVY